MPSGGADRDARRRRQVEGTVAGAAVAQKTPGTARIVSALPAVVGGHATASTSELDTYVVLAKAVGDPTRLRILKLIGSATEYPCTELERHLPVSKSTISHHVKILSHAGLVSVRREGKFFHYTLRRDVLEDYLPAMFDRL